MTKKERVVIGITGQSGSGKSTASEYICSQRDCIHIDVDKVAHSILNEFPVRMHIQEVFGNQMYDSDGKAIRSEIRKTIFSCQYEMKKFNSIMKNPIRDDVLRIIDENKGSNIIVNSALLKELDLLSACDYVIAIGVAFDLVYKKHKHLIENWNFQMSTSEYIGISDCLIANMHDEKFLQNVLWSYDMATSIKEVLSQ